MLCIPRIRNRSSLFAATLIAVVLEALAAPSIADANDWVYGNVKSVEDYGSFCCAPDGQPYEVLVDLTNTTWTVGGDATLCAQRFRIVTGLQGVTDDIKKRHFAMLLAAYARGAKVRLLYSTTGAPFCQVQIVSIGDF